MRAHARAYNIFPTSHATFTRVKHTYQQKKGGGGVSAYKLTPVCVVFHFFIIKHHTS
nr:MAG TPA: hypothetical protein [Caudoviricetes sp.]